MFVRWFPGQPSYVPNSGTNGHDYVGLRARVIAQARCVVPRPVVEPGRPTTIITRETIYSITISNARSKNVGRHRNTTYDDNTMRRERRRPSRNARNNRRLDNRPSVALRQTKSTIRARARIRRRPGRRRSFVHTQLGTFATRTIAAFSAPRRRKRRSYDVAFAFCPRRTTCHFPLANRRIWLGTAFRFPSMVPFFSGKLSENRNEKNPVKLSTYPFWDIY